MNFSDQLKTAQKKAIEDQNMSPQVKVTSIINDWYEILKKYCMMVAEKGGTTYNDNLHRYIQHLDDIYVDKQKKDENVNGSLFEEHFITYHRDSSEARHWENVRSCFFHYKYGIEYRTSSYIYHYPYIYGLEKEIAEYVCEHIKEKSKIDGLHIETKIAERNDLYKIEERYFEYSQIDKWFTGEQGRYKSVPIQDKKVYDIYVCISW